jgi:hypothetical protein
VRIYFEDACVRVLRTDGWQDEDHKGECMFKDMLPKYISMRYVNAGTRLHSHHCEKDHTAIVASC